MEEDIITTFLKMRIWIVVETHLYLAIYLENVQDLMGMTFHDGASLLF